MQFNLNGFIIALLALSVVSIQIGTNKYCRKVTNTYWWWLSIALFYMIYCICITWFFYWRKFADWVFPTDPSLYTVDDCTTISKAMFFNLCPLLNFMLPITLIADPSRKATRTIAPITVIASFAVLFLRGPLFSSNSPLSLHYIFIGDGNDLYVFGHAMNLFIAVGVLLNTPKIGWKWTLGQYAGVGSLFTYILIGSRTMHCWKDVSGTSIYDHTEGGYATLCEVLHVSPQWSIAILFIGMACFLVIAAILFDSLKFGHLYYGDKYSGCWWRWYAYDKTCKEKYPWGWFSRNYQQRHPNNLWWKKSIEK